MPPIAFTEDFVYLCVVGEAQVLGYGAQFGSIGRQVKEGGDVVFVEVGFQKAMQCPQIQRAGSRGELGEEPAVASDQYRLGQGLKAGKGGGEFV